MAITCLLIEDDLDDQEIFLIALQKVDPGIEYKLANNGVEGLEVLADQSFLPDFIFIDINMPKMNGIECLAIIHTRERLGNSRKIMLSTSSDSFIAQQCKTLGADEVLIKPPTIWELVRPLQRIIKKTQNE
jgi:CheY-like chemotaxis protein